MKLKNKIKNEMKLKIIKAKKPIKYLNCHLFLFETKKNYN